MICLLNIVVIHGYFKQPKGNFPIRWGASWRYKLSSLSDVTTVDFALGMKHRNWRLEHQQSGT